MRTVKRYAETRGGVVAGECMKGFLHCEFCLHADASVCARGSVGAGRNARIRKSVTSKFSDMCKKGVFAIFNKGERF